MKEKMISVKGFEYHCEKCGAVEETTRHYPLQVFGEPYDALCVECWDYLTRRQGLLRKKKWLQEHKYLLGCHITEIEGYDLNAIEAMVVKDPITGQKYEVYPGHEGILKVVKV